MKFYNMWNKRIIFAITLVSLSTIIHNASSYEILAIITLPHSSHYMAFKPFFEELTLRGDQVTVISNYPRYEKLKSLTDIDISGNRTKEKIKLNLRDYENMPSYFHNFYNLYRHFSIAPKNVKEDCENLMNNKDVQVLIRSNKKFDVIIVEQFLSDCSLGIAWLYNNTPIVGITSHVLMPWSYSRLGLPFNVATDPYYFSIAGSNPNFFRRVEIFVCNVAYTTVARWWAHSEQYSILSRHIPNLPPLEDIAKNMSLVLAYQYFPFTGVRLQSPRVVEIGGMHVAKNQSLDKELEKFMQSSVHGVIYVSFGSIIQASTMPKQQLQALLDAFAELPQNVLWKWEDDSIPNPPENLLLRKWMPQLDILCHPKVIAFISHGGMLGTTESIHCGVPVVTVPFFGDQFANAASVRESGLGVNLLFQDFSKENILKAIKDVLSEKYQSNAAELSGRWHDRPVSAMDSAVYWTHYVARYRSLARANDLPKTSLHQEYLLDVIIFTTGILLIVICLAYRMMQLLFVCFRRFIFILGHLWMRFASRKEKKT